jgi:hypothetical protein
MSNKQVFKPSLPASLPYKGAPLDVRDMIAETIRKEDHLVRPGTDVVAEVPQLPKDRLMEGANDATLYTLGKQIIRFTISLARP